MEIVKYHRIADNHIKFLPNNEFLKNVSGTYGNLGHPQNTGFELDNVTHKINSAKFIKFKFPRKRKKSYIKKYGRKYYNNLCKASSYVSFDATFLEGKELFADLYKQRKLIFSMSLIGSLDEETKTVNNAKFHGTSLRFINERL